MKQRIVFVADQIAHWHAGTERQMLLLARALEERGWSVPLYLLSPAEDAIRHAWPGEATNIGANSLRSPISWLRFNAVLRSEAAYGAMIVHCFLNDTSIIVPPMARAYRCKA